MKAKSFVIGLFLLVLVACTSKAKVPEPAVPEQGRRVEGPIAELAAIDSLMWHQPDSAFALLLDFASSTKADSLDVFNGHYCQMLISELLYKNYYEQTNRSSLLHAVAYFDSIVRQAPSLQRGLGGFPPFKGVPEGREIHTLNPNLAFLDARAHYINGVGYYEQGDMVQACAEYLKTLEVMEEHFGEKELVGHKARFMYYTYNRLGDLFYSQFMMESSITCFEKALSYYLIEPTSPTGVSGILNLIGVQYDMIGKKDSAMYYYERAMENISDTNSLIYRNVLSSKTLLSYQMNQDVQSAIKKLQAIVGQTTDEKERLARYLTMGDIYYEEGRYDSAQYYLELVFQNNEDIISKIRAAEFLRTIYDDIGDKEKAYTCVNFLAIHKKSDAESKAFVSNLNELFQNYLDQKKEKQAEVSREKAIKKVMSILIPIAVIVALAILIFAKLRGKKLLQDKEKHHKQEIESERQSHRMQQAALSGRLKKSHEEVRELKDQIQQQYDRMAKAEFAASFTEEPVCRLIMERVNEGQFKSKVDYTIYKDSALDKQQLLDLRLAADRHFGQFTSRLKKAYPELTNTDLDYCCLYLLGLTDADVAALMQRAYNTVIERNGKIRKIFGNENPLPVTLTGIANGFLSA